MYISLYYYNHVLPIPILPGNTQCKNVSRQMTLSANTIKKNYFGFASDILGYFVWRTCSVV